MSEKQLLMGDSPRCGKSFSQEWIVRLANKLFANIPYDYYYDDNYGARSSAKIQYKSFEQKVDIISGDYNKKLASFILEIPIGIDYETWRYLHKIKGDE